MIDIGSIQYPITLIDWKIELIIFKFTLYYQVIDSLYLQKKNQSKILQKHWRNYQKSIFD
jgi:hypothetical protein